MVFYTEASESPAGTPISPGDTPMTPPGGALASPGTDVAMESATLDEVGGGAEAAAAEAPSSPWLTMAGSPLRASALPSILLQDLGRYAPHWLPDDTPPGAQSAASTSPSPGADITVAPVAR